MNRLGILAAVAPLLMVAAIAGAAPALEEYGKLPAMEEVHISPAGDLVAYIANDNEGRKLIVRHALDATTLLAADAGKHKVRDIDWLDDDHVLITTTETLSDPLMTISKAELASSTIFNVRTSKGFTVFANTFANLPAMVHSTFGLYGVAHVDGRTFAFFGGLPSNLEHNYLNLYRVDAERGYPEKVAGGDPVLGIDWVVGSDGKVLAHSEYDSRRGELRVYDDPDDRRLIERLNDPIGDTYLQGLGQRPGDYVVHQGDSAGEWSLEQFTAGSAAPGRPLMDGLALKYQLYDPSTGLLIGGVTDEDDPKTVLLDPALQAKFDKVKRLFASEVAELVSATPNLDRMIVLTSGPQDSGTFFLVDMLAGKAQAIGWEHPGVLPDDVGPSSVFPYKAADGLAMEGILTLPPGRPGKDLPLVVLPHGGPEARDYVGFDWWAQGFAARGYAVFQPNFRGSNDFGKGFRDAGYGQWGRKMQTDISDGVAELARQGIVDSHRACIVGGSYGGYAALAGVTVQQGLYRCAVSVAGVADPGRMLAVDERLYGEASAATRGLRDFLGEGSINDISPIKLASRDDAPILIIHGRDDAVVPIEQSRDMAAALRSAHKDVQLIELPSEDHWLSRAATRSQMLTAAVAFVEKYDPPS